MSMISKDGYEQILVIKNALDFGKLIVKLKVTRGEK